MSLSKTKFTFKINYPSEEAADKIKEDIKTIMTEFHAEFEEFQLRRAAELRLVQPRSLMDLCRRVIHQAMDTKHYGNTGCRVF